MGLRTKSDLLEGLPNLRTPMRNNFDCLFEMARMLKSPEFAKPTQLPAVDMDMEVQWTQQLTAYLDASVRRSTDDASKLELNKLQFRRCRLSIV